LNNGFVPPVPVPLYKGLFAVVAAPPNPPPPYAAYAPPPATPTATTTAATTIATTAAPPMDAPRTSVNVTSEPVNGGGGTQIFTYPQVPLHAVTEQLRAVKLAQVFVMGVQPP